MTIKKQYLKSKPLCKVTFKIPAEKGNAAKTATVVGEFNNWSFTANPMKRLKNGAFTTTLDLDKGKAYQFRYVLDKNNWKMIPRPTSSYLLLLETAKIQS